MNPFLDLFVLKVRPEKLERSVTFYECLGFSFKQEVHGNGPIHYSSESNGYVFELYPLTKVEGYPKPWARLGFKVTPECLEKLAENKFEFFEKEYGYITQDPMGRFVELRIQK